MTVKSLPVKLYDQDGDGIIAVRIDGPEHDGWPLRQCALDDPAGAVYWTLDEDCYQR